MCQELALTFNIKRLLGTYNGSWRIDYLMESMREFLTFPRLIITFAFFDFQ